MFFFTMTDAHLKGLRCRNAVNSETEPIIRHHHDVSQDQLGNPERKV
jgi:hypothetical protein